MACSRRHLIILSYLILSYLVPEIFTVTPDMHGYEKCDAGKMQLIYGAGSLACVIMH